MATVTRARNSTFAQTVASVADSPITRSPVASVHQSAEQETNRSARWERDEDVGARAAVVRGVRLTGAVARHLLRFADVGTSVDGQGGSPARRVVCERRVVGVAHGVVVAVVVVSVDGATLRPKSPRSPYTETLNAEDGYPNAVFSYSRVVRTIQKLARYCFWRTFTTKKRVKKRQKE